jgi:hypothetical protein
MRTDDKTRLEEQRTHLLQEMRSMTEASKVAGNLGLSKTEQDRFEEVERQISSINGELQAGHEQELQEIRTGRGNGRFEISQATMAREFAREPLYEAFRRAGFARGKPAEILWPEFRSITWTGSVDTSTSRGETPTRSATTSGTPTRRFRAWASTRA